MIMKKFSAVFCTFLLVLSVISGSALAAEPDEKIIDLGDGFYLVETITQYSTVRSGDIVFGSKSGKVYYGSKVVGTAELYASFDISGSTAKAVNAGISGSGQNGWSYLNGFTSCSGNRASGTGYFESGSMQKSLTLTLSCSPDGSLS